MILATGLAVLTGGSLNVAFGEEPAAGAKSDPGEGDKVLFDFENEADIAAWKNFDLNEALSNQWQAAAADAEKAGKPVPAKPAAQKVEPAPKVELASEGATSGKRALKITFAGGRTPTITTPSPLADWRLYKTFLAEVTVTRGCMVVFRAMYENSKFGSGYNEGCSRWEFAARLEPGKNVLAAVAPSKTNIQTIQIYMYNPKEGEVVYIDNIRLSPNKSKTVSSFLGDATKMPSTKYKVLGTDLEVNDVNDLADKLKDKWVKPEDKTVEQVEAEVQAEYGKIKKEKPKAVLVILRDGQKGCDPADPGKVFAGWADAGTPSHLPMALTLACFGNSGKGEKIETCFRNRPGFLRVDLASIPKGADILSARLILSTGHIVQNAWETKPTMFAVEPCNRPWNEYEVNVFEYSKDNFWKDYAGYNWGDDGDCSAVFLAHGPSGGKTSTWDFTNAVKYWTDGKHANQGFILAGAPKYVDYLWVTTRECKDVAKRPALAVIYESK